MTLEQFMGRHASVALQFSAGKDSAACLKLLRPWIGQVVLVWVNQGDPYKETVEYMRRIKDSVPRFLEVKGRQREFVSARGYPADSVPFVGTPLGRVASRGPYTIVPIHECCGANLWQPMKSAIDRLKVTGVVRGEKRVDPLRSSLDGGMYGDKEYFSPLLEWTDSDVVEFLEDDLPPSYSRGLVSSLDCRTCTAYMQHNPGRIEDLAEVEPEAYAEIKPVVMWLTQQALDNYASLVRC